MNTMECFRTYEMYFPCSEPGKDLVHTGWYASFLSRETGETLTVPGFWDGDGIRIRYLPLREDVFDIDVRSGSMHVFSGTVQCVDNGKNHGPVHAEGCHFKYADGTLYLPFGTTCYALCHQDSDLIRTTLRSLSASPFNKVRICLFPKDYVYTRNEPYSFPFEKREDGSFDAARPHIPFWKRFEKVLDALQDAGIETDLILFHPYDRWGFCSFTMKECKTYLDYLLARFAARPGIWWSLANEFDLCTEKSVQDFGKLEEYVAENDPYHHLLSCHSFFANWDASRSAVTHLSLQRKIVNSTALLERKYGKPVVIDECGYEGNLPESFGCYSPESIVDRFWKCCAVGGYISHGETYRDESGDSPVFWSRGGTLKGKSIPRIAFLKKIMTEIGGPLTSLSDPMTDGLFPDGRRKIQEQIDEDEQTGKEGERTRFLKALLSCSREELLEVREGNMDYCGHYGDAAFLFYFGEHAYPSYTYTLPLDKDYRILALDPWAMSEKTVFEHVSGTTVIPLPGKPRMAVLILQNADA